MMSAENISNGKWQENAGVKKLLILALLVFSVAACRDANTSTLAASSSQLAANSPAASVGAETSYADVVSRVAPAVVTIHSELRVRAAQQFPFSDDPLLINCSVIAAGARRSNNSHNAPARSAPA